MSESRPALTTETLKKLEGYGRFARLVLYADSSGHVEVNEGAAWKGVFSFDTLSELEAHLDTVWSADAAAACL